MAASEPSRGDTVVSFDTCDVVEAWRRGATARAEILGPATELMLDLAGVGVGSRVLDVGAGTGEQTLAAARRVGPSGFVLATDVARAMLDVAIEAAQQEGLANVATRVMDAEDLDVEADSFDAAISRNLLMLLGNPLAALVGIRRALVPGGKLAAIVFSTAERNPFFARPIGIARRVLGLPSPPPGQPGMFALGEPGALEDLYARAGFSEVTVHRVSTARRVGSAREAANQLREYQPVLRDLTARMSDAERERTWAEIEQDLRAFEGPDGLSIRGESLIGVGTK